jgi:PUA domain protein
MRFLSNKEKKNLLNELPIGYEFSKKDEITEGKDNVIYKNKEKFLIVFDDKYLPHLKSVNENSYKAVYVDRGAIPFVIKGADLMRPGIQKIDSGFEKDEIILIKDEEHSKTIAIGFALFSSVDMKNQEKGKSVKIYHYVGDDFY